MAKMSSVSVAITWCLAWGDERKPKYDLPVLQKMHQALKIREQVAEEFQELVDAVNSYLAPGNSNVNSMTKC
ncbi:hypothetical protein [Nostoc sp. FACHB-888]|uniref:hypothetical protein n=1 Tax=Nostoc sp. FACHB-888 TaxID=2692842 RepID=UPI001688545A|nr:hypothetical protein [Nostoc sp. FACHB-888]MBD2248500.1 hypothetical protein [Nostoc sp. FACHB-888]